MGAGNIRILEIIGFILIGGTVYAFLGMMGSDLKWPVFWTCAGGAFVIIIYRQKLRKER